MKRIGWVGYSDNKPFFENTTDDYVNLGDESVQVVNVYKRKKDALKRFEDVREVFVKENNE